MSVSSSPGTPTYSLKVYRMRRKKVLEADTAGRMSKQTMEYLKKVSSCVLSLQEYLHSRDGLLH